MDNNEILSEAHKSLLDDINNKFTAFNLLPEKFTMRDVQDIYETIFEREYVRTNFQKKILEMDVLERLEKKFTGAANKAPYLYKMKDTWNFKFNLFHKMYLSKANTTMTLQWQQVYFIFKQSLKYLGFLKPSL